MAVLCRRQTVSSHRLTCVVILEMPVLNLSEFEVRWDVRGEVHVLRLDGCHVFEINVYDCAVVCVEADDHSLLVFVEELKSLEVLWLRLENTEDFIGGGGCGGGD